jgi:hypothetical protein
MSVPSESMVTFFVKQSKRHKKNAIFFRGILLNLNESHFDAVIGKQFSYLPEKTKHPCSKTNTKKKQPKLNP